MLSADKLEYTLGGRYLIGNISLIQLKEIYEDITISTNEHDTKELCFRSFDKSKQFTRLALKNSYIYVSNENRFLMQYLSEIMRYALNIGVSSNKALYTTESQVIHKLINSSLSETWQKYTSISAIAASKKKPHNKYCVKVSAKKRYINPLVLTDGGAKRITETDNEIKSEIENFLSLDFGEWLY